jgi:cytochrome c-type biogenesis protein CcmE
MRTGILASAFLGILGLTAMVGALLTNSSQYVTVAEARKSEAKSLHLAGDLVPDSYFVDLREGTVRFTVVDTNGESVQVRYQGSPPNNLKHATRVVAIGRYEDGAFVSHKLLLKCPSKYEADKGAGQS